MRKYTTPEQLELEKLIDHINEARIPGTLTEKIVEAFGKQLVEYDICNGPTEVEGALRTRFDMITQAIVDRLAARLKGGRISTSPHVRVLAEDWKEMAEFNPRNTTAPKIDQCLDKAIDIAVNINQSASKHLPGRK